MLTCAWFDYQPTIANRIRGLERHVLLRVEAGSNVTELTFNNGLSLELSTCPDMDLRGRLDWMVYERGSAVLKASQGIFASGSIPKLG